MSRPNLVKSRITPGDYPDSDPRVGNLLTLDYHQARIIILGFPCDEGVSRNGGRAGAAEAPDAIRRQLFKLCPDPQSKAHRETLASTLDIGDVATGSLEEMQATLGEVVAGILNDGKIPVILGGGHETAYGHFLGYERAGKDVSIVNLDAHADVRPLKGGLGHSGSPFRQAAGHVSGRLKHYSVSGLQPHAVSRDHVAYLEEKSFAYSFRDEYSTERYADCLQKDVSTMATIDMDVVDSAFAPGVSAPATNGLSSANLLDAMYVAGLSPNVHSIDVVEVNPTLDIDNRTARLAALGIWNFLRGVSDRTT